MDQNENKECLQESEAIETVACEEVQETVIAEPETPEQEAVEQDTPVAAPVKKCRWKKVLKISIACLLVIGLIAGCCGASIAFVNYSWSQTIWQWSAINKRSEQTILQLQEQIKDLEEQLNDKSFTGNGNSLSGTPNTGTDGGMTPAQVYAKSVRSVVAISNQQVTTNIYGQVSQTASSGSGFILTEDGYVVTNHHVVEGATKLTVILYDEREYEATYIGGSPQNDLAVLKINAQGLTPLPLGRSDDLIVGDQVIAIGNPLGELTSTLTVGYISAKDRKITSDGSLVNMLQTDAAINSGNSGGPLLNMNGEVIGIITAKYSGTTSSGASIEGIGFALPIDDVSRMITDLRDYGYITGAYLGVGVKDLDHNVSDYLGIPYGVYVQDVTLGSCAYKAGIQPKDLITGMGGKAITSINDLTRVLMDFRAGDTTTITVWRGGLDLELTITLDEKPHGSLKKPADFFGWLFVWRDD